MSNQRGNMLFYILIAVVLFAAVSFAAMRMMSGSGDAGAKETAKLGAQSILEYVQKAKITVQDMKLNGVETTNLSFLKDGDAGYTTAPHTNKVFHPDGGGLPVMQMSRVVTGETYTPVSGVYMVLNAFEGNGTAADDVVISFRGLRKAVCEELNRQLNNSTTIPATGINSHYGLFITGSNDMTTIRCASCEGRPSMCVTQSGQTLYTFYTVIDAN